MTGVVDLEGIQGINRNITASMFSNETASYTYTQGNGVENRSYNNERVNSTLMYGGSMLIYPNPFNIPHIKVIFIILYSIVFACCFFGNLLVMLVILRHHKMRTVTNFFLCNLALADFCVGVFCVIPNLLLNIQLKWVLGKVLCKCYFFISAMSYTASVIILTVISFERYVAIIYPIRSKQVASLTLLRVVIIAVWIIAAASGAPFLIMYNTVDMITGDSFCIPRPSLNYNNEAHSLANIILGYIVPLLLMTCMYTRISVVLWSSSGGGKLIEKVSQKKKGKCNPMIRIDPPDEITKAKIRLPGRTEGTTEETRALDPQSMIMSNGNSGDLAKERRWNFKSKNNCSKDEKVSSIDNTPVDYEDDWPSNKKKKSAVEMSNIARGTHFNNSSGKCDGKMVVSLTCHSGQRSMPINRKQDNALIARRKVIRLLVSVIISFALCVLPYHIRMLWTSFFSPSISFSGSLFPPITFLFYYMNSGLNPILYAFLSENFRRCLVEVITCSQRTSRRGAVRNQTYGSRTTHYTLNSTCA